MLNKKSVFYEILDMSTNNIEDPSYSSIETFFDRCDIQGRSLKRAYNFILKSYPHIKIDRLNRIYNLFLED